MAIDISESQILALREKQVFEFATELPDLFIKRCKQKEVFLTTI